jgi:ketosteroid isomerase-like protein
MSTQTPDALLRSLADKEEIRDLARRYAHCVWQEDADGAIDLFADDGEMNIGGQMIAGRANLLKAYKSMLAGQGLQPFIHNHVVEIDGDRAKGTCYLDLRAAMGGKSMIGAGYYNDAYVRTAKGWKFASRHLTLKFFVPVQDGWA